MSDKPRSHRSRRRTVIQVLVVLLMIWLVVAYLILPADWMRFEKRHPGLVDIPTITRTKSDIPGDPLNVAIIGSELEFKKAILRSGWYPADPLTLKSCLEIAEATVLERPYDDAPVSNLFWDGRREDLAFEKPVGHDPRRRHHVRFWKSKRVDEEGNPAWIGGATFDERVGLSHTTGQITHHIAAEVDAERDGLLADLQNAGLLDRIEEIANFQNPKEGKNGGGDPWHTDGVLKVGVLRAQ